MVGSSRSTASTYLISYWATCWPYSRESAGRAMKVFYADEVEALYLKLGDEPPEGVIEVSEGVNRDTTSKNKIVGIEI